MGSASVGFICGGSFIEICWKSEFVGLFIKYNEQLCLIGPDTILFYSIERQ